MMKLFLRVFSYLILPLLFQNIIAQNSSPTAVTDYDTADVGSVVSVNAPGVLSNDIDADGDALFVTHFFVDNTLYLAGTLANFSYGSIIINVNGSYTFTPNATEQEDDPITILYSISDGENTAISVLDFTVQENSNLLNIDYVISCNQGYTTENEYQIFYQIRISNTSTAKDYHSNSLITDIDLTNDLDAIFGNSCVNLIDYNFFYNTVVDYVNNPYPQEYSTSAFNQSYLNGNSDAIFTSSAVNNITLYPRQSLTLLFCVNVDASCAGNNVDFDNIYNITSSTGNTSNNIEITDFHTTETFVSAGLYLPEAEAAPEINPNSTFDYTTTIVINNGGNATANNINYNMGLSNFIDELGSFNSLNVTQVSGPTVTTNADFDGVNSTELLTSNNSLAAGETIVLEVYALSQQTAYEGEITFDQMTYSQTQGPDDGQDETLEKNTLSFVSWSDNSGNHLDRYYNASTINNPTPIFPQCHCQSSGINFDSTVSSSTTKSITNTNSSPNGIIEHEEITFQITIENTSPAIQLENLQVTENLNTICDGNIISITSPSIESSSANTNPILNSSFNGIDNTTIFNGTSGILLPEETITVEFTVLFYEDCIGVNDATFSFTDPIGTVFSGSSDSENVNTFTDTDSDLVYNSIDIDDDNDTIRDVDEYNGLDPLDDDDNDFIPNYRDTDFGVDINNDGIVDLFDFDLDGIPNHFDIDSDNDGIFDIVEVNNENTSEDSDGMASLDVGSNGLHNDVEIDDTAITNINYTIPNTDNTGDANFIDIDADGDGIVDNIEGQSSLSYISTLGTVNLFGLDNAYPQGITPIDSDGDTNDDYIDINSDNDIRDDYIEGWDTDNDGNPEITAPTSYNDSDGDGLDDVYDLDNNSFNSSNTQTVDDFPNLDNPENLEKDWRETITLVISINNVTTTEGNDLLFTISLITNGDNPVPVQNSSDIIIELTTNDGIENANTYEIAYAPYDYTSISSLEITIPAHTENATFTVSSIDDNIYELNETFSVDLSVVSGLTSTKNISGIGTITDNEDPPTIFITSEEEEEGVDLNHTINISHPSSTPINIEVNTSDDEAISPNDYTSVTENLSIDGTIDESDSNTEIRFTIPTIIDNTNELDTELLDITATIVSNNVTNNNIVATGTIIDIDPDPFVKIKQAEAVEGNDLNFTISLLNDQSQPMFNHLPITFNIRTEDINTTESQDYQAINSIVTIPAYTSSIENIVNTIDDKLNEGSENLTFFAQVTSPNLTSTGQNIESQGVIKDNDVPNLFSPNGDGLSDVFEITSLRDFPNFKITIFDRWGSKVYEYNNNGRTEPLWWDGTLDRKKIPEGVYYYTLEYNDNETQPTTNFIQLVR